MSIHNQLKGVRKLGLQLEWVTLPQQRIRSLNNANFKGVSSCLKIQAFRR